MFATSTEKVSLEEVVEVINNDRPEAYYFAKYTDKEKAQFAQAALGMTDPYTLQTPIPEPDSPTFTYKLTDLDIHNQKVEAEALRSKIRNTKRRAGKKKREFVVVCRERKLERVKVEKKIKKEQARLRYLAQYNRGKKRKFT